MKIVLTGGAGNISRPLAEKLLKAGHDVTVIGRNADNLKPLTDAGAKAAIGSVKDVDFLIKTFSGADAVYTMVPPDFSAPDMKANIASIGKIYAKAIKQSGVKYVVNLSSVGAHLPDGCGPVSGLYKVEQALNELKDVNIKHLRPVYFYNNLLANIGLVKHMNIIGGNFGGADFKMLLVDPSDISQVAFEEISNLDFKGHSVRYIASDERGTDEIAKLFGDAIGKPGLPWVVFSDEQALGGMLQAGLPENAAANYAEMGHAMQSGAMFEDYWENRPAVLGKTKLEDFAKTFAFVYNQN